MVTIKPIYKQRFTIDDMQTLAKKRGGICLSKKYITGKIKLTWQCKKGHTWDATPKSIKQQSWCPNCAKGIHDIEFMRKLARKKIGICLSKEFISVTKKLTWQCDKGHKWDARPSSVKDGSWCPKCNYAHAFYIEDMHRFAKKHKGVFVSNKYQGHRVKHIWQCKNGHIFKDSYENISRRNNFCIKCKSLS